MLWMKFHIVLLGIVIIIVSVVSCARLGEEEASDLLRSEIMAESGVTGSVMRKSDVFLRPNSPMQALVLVVPSDKTERLLKEAGIVETSELGLRRLGLLLTKELSERYVGAQTTSKRNGAYELTVSPGDYTLCLARSVAESPGDIFPVRLYGCIEITIPQGKKIEQGIYWGEAGVTPR